MNLKTLIESECLDLGFEQTAKVEEWLDGIDNSEIKSKVLALNEAFLKDCEAITEKWIKAAEGLGL